ncbi:Aste57867_23735 [Aphanomyces stellatus]|uniref:Aste57867_23735 protein n=1 Tax=Aphanomyces stellatus TaxID=120398 RepID=A0A485LQ51_9STRA|nr:hypothetical protein As57867_023663 [Aphanomyces stellatus]VFU00380.1 Aste57867_23735 [Aphanomyces stellatus]
MHDEPIVTFELKVLSWHFGTNEMDDTESWDIVRDLHFLFANDDELRDELSYVCDLLTDAPNDPPPAAVPRSIDDDGDDEAAVEPKAAPKRPRAPVVVPETGGTRQQREIRALREQVDLLKDELIEAKRQVSLSVDMSAWERAARDQLYAKSKSLQENEQLRAVVAEQATFIDDMMRVLRKKPRLTTLDVHSDAWRTYKLAAQTSLRTAAIHAIADRQYAQLQTAMIQAGIYNCDDDIVRSGPTHRPDGQVLVERVYHVTLAAPFRLIGSAVWNVTRGNHAGPLSDGAEETLEVLDPCTIYRSFTKTKGAHAAHSNMVYKYFVERAHETVVWRSVLEDALVPHMTDGTVHDEWGWLAVAPLTETSCRLSLLLQLVPEPLHDDATIESSVEEIMAVSAHIMDKYAFAHPPDAPGTFPGGPVKEDTEGMYLPFAKKTFVERGKRLEMALKEVIDAIVDEFQRTQTVACGNAS